MSSMFQQFKALHRSPELFVLPNAWNAKSAQQFQQEGFRAVATSSAAVADSLGYGDGEGMYFNDYMFMIDRIVASVQVPVSVDIEMGYGSTDEKICNNLFRLADIGVAGINIEDSVVEKKGRSLRNADAFAARLSYLQDRLVQSGRDLFINVRCDVWLLGVKNKRQEAAVRMRAYESAGADGIFLPGITSEEDIAAAVAMSSLPLNVMCVPGLPCFDTLQTLGVKRVSMGPFFFQKMYNDTAKLSRAIAEKKCFEPILV
ncbi:MAG: isocitrate lyase/phosphoenolpyruvate mutase family protein [Bacteroidetes bacterium]|nr:isocitrate lyase/phosphoenolpyruvate mutase family protein [Bacteroidota bacterium]